jgi:recombination protein RecA
VPPRKKQPVKLKATAQELMDEVNAKMGNKALFLGSDPALEVEYVSTGMLPLDVVFQGGVPRGRMVEIYGDYSTLKSVVGLSTAAQVQAAGGTAALLDTEHSYEPQWAKKIGVDTSKLIVWPPRDDDEEHTGEEAIDAAQLLTSRGCDLIIFDSVAALYPQAEAIKRLKGESIQPARLAQLMSAGLRRLTAANNKTAFIFINQVRMNVGVTFGNPEVATGGRALPFYASSRLNIRKTGKITKDAKIWNGEKWVTVKEQTAQIYRAELLKSKLTKPFREVFFTWDLQTGQIDLPGYLIAQGLEMGLIKVRGNTWSFGAVRGVGKTNFKNAFTKNQQAMHQLEQEVREFHGLPRLAGSPVPVRKTLRRAP